MILTVCNYKGGVGKSTIALNIALIRAIQGAKVWAIDGDRQATLSIALSMREGHPLARLDKITEGKDLLKQVKAKAGDYDLTVIDAGGRDSTSLRAALLCSDIALIPFAPRSADVWALTDTALLVKEAREHNPKLRALAFLNGADNAGTDNAAAAAAAAGVEGLEFLDCPIKRRKSVANASGEGLAITEAKPKDKKAEAELLALLKALAQPKLI